MRPGIVIGLAGGAAFGASLGVVLERTTHVPEDQPLSKDAVAWDRSFRDHFADEIDTDAATDAHRRADVERWHDSANPPEWLDVSRSDVEWQVEMPKPEARGTNGWLLGVGLVGGLASLLPMMALDRSGTDVRNYVGWRGAAAFAPVATVGAFIAGYLVSDVSH